MDCYDFLTPTTGGTIGLLTRNFWTDDIWIGNISERGTYGVKTKYRGELYVRDGQPRLKRRGKA